MRKLLLLALLLATLGGTVSGQTPSGAYSSPASAGGGISSATSLPALPCTNGAVVSLTTGNTGIYVCSSGAWVNQGNPNNMFNASNFGVTASGNEDCSATFTNGSPTVTTSANTRVFTAADNGATMWGTTVCVDSTVYAQVVAVGTLSVTGGQIGTHVATMSNNANGNAAGTATQHFIWGPVEDTQLTAAETAAFSYGGADCFSLWMPAGIILVKKGHFNVMSCNSQTTGTLSTGAHIYGEGRVATRLMMTPDFDYTTCPTFTFNTCFGAKNGITKMNFGISGGQTPGTNPAAATCVMNDGTDDFSINVGLFGLGSILANLRGYCTSNAGATPELVIEDGMGSIGWFAAGANQSCTQCFFGDNGTAALQGSSGAIIETFANGLGPTNSTTGEVQITGAGSLWHSKGDVILVSPSSNFVLCNSGALCSIEGMHTFGSVSGAMNAFAVGTANGHITVKDSVMSSGNTGFMWNLATSTALGDDLGGNVFTTTAGQVVNLTAGASLRRIVPTSTYTNPPGPGLASCASSAAPAVCSSWLEGAVVIAAGATTVQVNTTQVLADSEILVNEDQTLGTKLGVTCNTQSSLVLGTPRASARSAGTSFTLTIDVAPTTNPMCINFSIR